MINKLYNFFLQPQVALVIIIIFLLSYILYNAFTGGFNYDFLTFGPTKDKNGDWTHYMGMTLDSWQNVGIVYCLIFISSMLNFYYGSVVFSNIETYVFTTSKTAIPYSKLWTYIIFIINPLIKTITYVVQFFATATFQIQYIIPQLLARYIIELPYVLNWLKGKKFIK
jgi:hypothetical protein